MKNSHSCSKCGASDVVRIPGRGLDGGNAIRLGATVFSLIVPVARYVCVVCGYAEEWVEDPEDLRKLAKKMGDKST